MSGELKSVFDFDKSGVLLNQNNQLSEKQGKLLDGYARINKLGGRISFVIMLVSMSLFIMVPIFAVGIDDLRKYPETAYSCLVVFSIIRLLYIISVIRGKLHSDIKSRKIFAGRRFRRI